MLAVSKNIKFVENNRIYCVDYDSTLLESDEKELHFWRNDPLESDQNNLLDNIVHKSAYIKIFSRILSQLELKGNEKILEIGGGHGWASALMKRKYPDSYVVLSDISPDAVRFVENYENILKVWLDEKWSFNCRNMPFQENQFDVLFTFASFHHFGVNNDFNSVLKELVKVIKPGGKILLLYEPSTPKYLYNIAYRRVKNIRKTVDEDVLILSDLKKNCQQNGCEFYYEFFPDYQDRKSIVANVYYYFLSHLKIFQYFLPCTVNITITRK